MSDCRFGVSPVNYPDPDPGPKMCCKNFENRFTNKNLSPKMFLNRDFAYVACVPKTHISYNSVCHAK